MEAITSGHVPLALSSPARPGTRASRAASRTPPPGTGGSPRSWSGPDHISLAALVGPVGRRPGREPARGRCRLPRGTNVSTADSGGEQRSTAGVPRHHRIGAGQRLGHRGIDPGGPTSGHRRRRCTSPAPVPSGRRCPRRTRHAGCPGGPGPKTRSPAGLPEVLVGRHVVDRSTRPAGWSMRLHSAAGRMSISWAVSPSASGHGCARWRGCVRWCRTRATSSPGRSPGHAEHVHASGGDEQRQCGVEPTGDAELTVACRCAPGGWPARWVWMA